MMGNPAYPLKHSGEVSNPRMRKCPEMMVKGWKFFV